MVRSGTLVPGDCCDVHECINKPGTNCSQVKCPVETVQCPPDSYKLPSSLHPGDCCSKYLGCQCLPSCSQPSCSEEEVPRVVRVGTFTPGSCCPIYECVAKDMNESCENGTSWLSADCEECKCERGIKFCSKVECPKLPEACTKSEIGQCCPVCLEESTPSLSPSDLEIPRIGDEYLSCLLENGTLLHVGDTYFADPCTNCTCLHGGQKKCTASMCEVPCVNPQYVPGECCPVCDGSTPFTILRPHCTPLANCKLRCKRGFVMTDDGCITCECQDEECLLDCQHGLLKDTNGNNLCECAPPPAPPTCPPLVGCTKECPHGFKRKQGCEICRCAQCPSMNQCEKQCAHGYARDENGCHMCKCKPSSTSTTEGEAAAESCYTEDGVWRDDSEIWRDGCRECHCIDGREMCTLIACPTLSCQHPIPANSTQCCPYCPDATSSGHEAAVCMDFHGELKLEGQHWTLNPCTDCTCREGKVLCYSQQCPAAACSNPRPPEPGTCCPRCAGADEITALVVENDGDDKDCGGKNGTAWREGACISCRCERGHKICYQQECPNSTPCVRSVQPKHACCPTCLDALLPKPADLVPSGCTVGNVTYQENQEWRLDACTSCVCKDRSHHCTQRICSVTCSNPMTIPNQCCPLCLDTPTPPSGNDSPESATNRQIRESLYILLIVLFAVSTLFAFYACRQLRARRNRLHLTEYGCPPPQYQYKYIPTYEGPRPISPEEKEKLALAPVVGLWVPDLWFCQGSCYRQT
ncbi:hypothetical protein M8J77_013387 [Diaphorina citri]|nr:hypothetical protein M8J77_013387 [Diaphorina citri]